MHLEASAPALSRSAASMRRWLRPRRGDFFGLREGYPSRTRFLHVPASTWTYPSSTSNLKSIEEAYSKDACEVPTTDASSTHRTPAIEPSPMSRIWPWCGDAVLRTPRQLPRRLALQCVLLRLAIGHLTLLPEAEFPGS